MPTIRAFVLAMCLAAMAAAPPASAQQGCIQVNLAPGEAETTIFGIAPPSDMLCYMLNVPERQRISVKVTNGKNVIFVIAGVTDANNEFSFMPQRRTFRLEVGQMMRSVTEQPFIIKVSVAATGGSSLGSRLGDPGPGTTGRTRTGEVVNARTESERRSGEADIETVKRANLDQVLRQCENEFRQFMASYSELRGLDRRTLAFVNRERVHIVVNFSVAGNHPTSPVYLISLLQARDARGAQRSFCMTCNVAVDREGVSIPVSGDSAAGYMPLGRHCPGG